MDNIASGTNTNNSTSDFLNSNSLVAKMAFLLLIIFLFVIVFRMSLSFLTWLFRSNDSPRLIDGMVDAKQMMVIPQAPSQKGAKTVGRSINAVNGIEYTWSTWLFINDLGMPDEKYHHIFHKGNDTTASNGLNFPNNSPGMYISPNTNELTVIVNTFDSINEEITIPDIPLNKWFNVMIRARNTSIDIYVNGVVTKSVKLLGVPKQNYGDVYVAMNGGFDGYISNLWYYNYALGTTAIQNLVKKGPNTKMVGSSNAMNLKNPDYLSLRWYFYGNQDMYNP